MPTSSHAAAAARSSPLLFSTPAVQHQAHVAHVFPARERREDGLGIGHLRHSPGIDEAGDLDAAQAGSRDTIDEVHLDRCRQGLRLRLQAVTRPHLDDLDSRFHSSLQPRSLATSDGAYLRSAAGSMHFSPLLRLSRSRPSPL